MPHQNSGLFLLTSLMRIRLCTTPTDREMVEDALSLYLNHRVVEQELAERVPLMLFKFAQRHNPVIDLTEWAILSIAMSDFIEKCGDENVNSALLFKYKLKCEDGKYDLCNHARPPMRV